MGNVQVRAASPTTSAALSQVSDSSTAPVSSDAASKNKSFSVQENTEGLLCFSGSFFLSTQ